jgi:hypothetical protein
MIAAAVQSVSHDQLTRLLASVIWEGQALLNRMTRALFGKIQGGYLIIDDTVIAKHFAKVVECVFWVWSSKENRAVLGINIVVLSWSNGAITIPLAFRIWQKGGPSKLELAIELLRYAKKTLKLSPEYALFDSFYAGKKLLKFLSGADWKFVSQVKRNRLFNGAPVKLHRRNPYWIADGTIDGDLEVRIVKHGKKYFVTNDPALAKQEILALYKLRWKIEEVFRFLHGKLGMDDCQARLTIAHQHHIALCFLAAVCIERERHELKLTRYQLKRKLSLQREHYQFIALKPFFEGA